MIVYAYLFREKVMKCETAQKQVSLYFNHGLDDDQINAVDHHVANCVDCYSFYYHFTQTFERITKSVTNNKSR